MAHDQNDSPAPRATEPGDTQLRSLISLFNWLVGEVVTARVMVLRLAADLVRMGVLPIEEINGMPLTQEIIESVMSNFPTDPVWNALGHRLRSSLDALRHVDLYGEDEDGDEEDEFSTDDLDAELAGDDGDEDDGEEMEAQVADAQVIYRNPDHEHSTDGSLAPRTGRISGRKHN